MTASRSNSRNFSSPSLLKISAMDFFARLTISLSVSIESQPNCLATSLATRDFPVPENPVITILVVCLFIFTKILSQYMRKAILGQGIRSVFDFEVIATRLLLEQAKSQDAFRQGALLPTNPNSYLTAD